MSTDALPSDSPLCRGTSSTSISALVISDNDDNLTLKIEFLFWEGIPDVSRIRKG